MAKGIVVGVLLTLAAFAVGGYCFVIFGLMPANADGRPPALERWAAHRSLRATLRREAPKTPDPLELSAVNLVAGIRLYGQNCAVCHGASDGGASNIAMGLYQHAPQLAKDGVEDDPEGFTFWKIKHGIRLTGMPSFGKALTDRQIWELTLFLKHMDSLPPAAQRAWKDVPSSATRS